MSTKEFVLDHLRREHHHGDLSDRGYKLSFLKALHRTLHERTVTDHNHDPEGTVVPVEKRTVTVHSITQEPEIRTVTVLQRGEPSPKSPPSYPPGVTSVSTGFDKNGKPRPVRSANRAERDSLYKQLVKLEPRLARHEEFQQVALAIKSVEVERSMRKR